MDSNYIAESNEIASPHAWLWLLEITTPDYVDPLRYVNNSENVDWPTVGTTFTRMPFRMDDIHVSTSGAFPEFKLEIEDVDLAGALRTRVAAAGGLVGSTVRFMVVHSDHLANDLVPITTAAVDEYADILSCALTNKAVVFTIGTPNLLTRRFPRDRYVPGYCRHRFEGALCQYTKQVFPTGHSRAGETVSYTSVNNVKFETTDYGDDPPVNKITIADTSFSFISLLKYAKPLGTETLTLALAKDAGFTISGTQYNDGFFLADDFYAVNSFYVYVVAEIKGAQVFTPETVVTPVTFTLGYTACDHTLEACRLRDNSQNFGGSPGIAGGVYG